MPNDDDTLELAPEIRTELLSFYDSKLQTVIAAGWRPYWVTLRYTPRNTSFDKNTRRICGAFVEFYYDILGAGYEGSGAISMEAIPYSIWPLVALTSPRRLGHSHRKIDDHLLREGVTFCGYIALCPEIPFFDSFDEFLKNRRIKYMRSDDAKRAKPGYFARPQVERCFAGGPQIHALEISAWIAQRRPPVEDFLYGPFMQPH